MINNSINNINNDIKNSETKIEVDSLDFENFKTNVKNYLIVDDDIKKLELHVREKKKEKQNFTDSILHFMNNHNIEDLSTETGKLQRNISYTKKPLNKKTLKTKLLEYFKNNESQTESLFKFIDNRDKEEKIKLKRVINK